MNSHTVHEKPFRFFRMHHVRISQPLNTGLDALAAPNAIEWNYNYVRSAPARADRRIFNHFKGEPHVCSTPG